MKSALRILAFLGLLFSSVAIAHTDGIYNPTANSVGDTQGIDSNSSSGGTPWTPLNDAGLVEWWDSTQGVTGTTNVTNWDGRKAAHSVVNLSGVNRPSYPVTINGVNALNFSSANLKATAFTQGPNFTLVAVLQPANNTGTQNVIDADNEVTRIAQYIRNNAGTLETIAFNGPGSPFTASGGALSTAAVMVGSWCPSTPIIASMNGTDGSPVTVTLGGQATGSSILTFGDHSTAGGTTYAGIMGDVVLSVTVTVSNKQKMEGFEAWKFGLQALLPVGHPYKTRPPLVTDP